MSRGPKSAPPDLPGFVPDRWIGGGGFADVFVYNQLRPSRPVAVKILRREHLSPQALAQFDSEADLMAEVSTHPYIVTIFASGVAPDGRPYIVMEHYPLPNFGERARGGNLDLPEVLRTGIQVASAVETAHRAGIIHRDIKPANILTSTFGRPGLTDFGISGVQTEGIVAEAIGITVAYTAPELLNEDSTGSVATDVYGLGATISALAAGHSPFWSPSGDNGDQAVLARALSGQISPVTRPDIPNSLNHLLAQTMQPTPASRPASALALAQALQEIEQELRLQPTQVEVAAAPHIPGPPPGVDRSDPEDKDGTRRSIQVVHPHAAPSSLRPSAIPAPTHRPPIIAASTPRPAAPTAPAKPTPPRNPSTPAPGLPSPDYEIPAPAIGGVPFISNTVYEDAETVSRASRSPREPATFTPSPGTPAPTFDHRGGYRPGPLLPPLTDERTSTPLPTVHSVPWKPIGIVAVVLIVIGAAIGISSLSGRNSNAGPGTNNSPQGPPQSMNAGNLTEPIATPPDLSLNAFTTAPNGTWSTAFSWTSAGKDVPYQVDAIAYGSAGPASAVTLKVAAGASNVTLSLQQIPGSATCTGVNPNGAAIAKKSCLVAPPCIRIRTNPTGAAVGNWVSASAGPTAALTAGGVAITADQYEQACNAAFSGMNS